MGRDEKKIEEKEEEKSELENAIKDKVWWYKNCKIQRRKKAKICNSCPFRNQIERLENNE